MPLMLLQVISIPAVGALDEAGFDREVEALCTAHYASGVGRPGVPPGRYFRMLLVGYFEVWRVSAGSLALRRQPVTPPFPEARDERGGARPQHAVAHPGPAAARAPRCRVRPGAPARGAHGLVKGRRVGVDASTMEANAPMRSIVRRADGVGWHAMLGELARSSGIATRSTEQLRQLDRTRKGKRVSNAHWASPSDPEARITPAQGRSHAARLQASRHWRHPGGRGPARCRGHEPARASLRARRCRRGAG